jgi:hypothetical protein
MIDFIEIDNNCIAYCTSLNDGRICKVLIKPTNMIVYVCEECETMWLSLSDIFDASSGVLLTTHIKNLVKQGIIYDLNEAVEYLDFVFIEDVLDIVKAKKIRIETI